MLTNELPIFEQRLVRGIDDDLSIESVQESITAVVDIATGRMQSNHGWNAQGPRHDGGVRCLAAHVGREAEHELFVQLRRLCRTQIIADDDARLLEMQQA